MVENQSNIKHEAKMFPVDKATCPFLCKVYFGFIYFPVLLAEMGDQPRKMLKMSHAVLGFQIQVPPA